MRNERGKKNYTCIVWRDKNEIYFLSLSTWFPFLENGAFAVVASEALRCPTNHVRHREGQGFLPRDLSETHISFPQ